MATPAPPDPLARGGAIAIAASRIAIGAVACAFTRPALARIGFPSPSASSVALARLAGARDVALGANALAARGDAERLRNATLLASTVDAADAAAFAVALAGRHGIDRAALMNFPVAAGAVVAGGWVSARLSRSSG